MSWFKQRIIARVLALLPSDWTGTPGNRFRKAMQSISRIAEEKNLRPEQLMSEGVELSRRKLTGLANHEYAEALRQFAETENLKIAAELARRSLESKVRQDEADARLKEISVVEAELVLIKHLETEGYVLHRNSDGDLTVLPGTGRRPDYTESKGLSEGRGMSPLDE
jgi:hypothetical protein